MKQDVGILVAMDSFKGSLTSAQAGDAVKKAALEVFPEGRVTVKILADGGEGTLDAFASLSGFEKVELTVTGPLGYPVRAAYGIIKGGMTAVIEAAQAAGLTLVAPCDRDPMKTSTYGVGELIADAVKRGCRKFIVGIGGSATNDGGAGMLRALGFSFADKDGNGVPFGAEGLARLCSIGTENVTGALADCEFTVACDVENPLCGENGCSYVFAPQKGAHVQDIPKMDAWLSHYADVARAVSAKADKNAPGAGAAGGLGFAFLSFTNARLESGVGIVMRETELEKDVKNADLVVTGEGRLDAQTAMGKAPAGVARLAKKYGKPVLAFSGCTGAGAERCNGIGIDAYFPVLQSVTSAENAMLPETAYANVMKTARQAFRMLLINI